LGGPGVSRGKIRIYVGVATGYYLTSSVYFAQER
jgi:hypothetical protein